MPKHSKLNDNHFLNSLPLMEMRNAKDLEPLYMLESIFVSISVQGLQEILQKVCNAAMAEEYAWKDGMPVNLLLSVEKLEQLIETCYLINISRNKNSIRLKKYQQQTHFLTVLSEEEMNEPKKVIKEFFKVTTLPKWKLALRTWLEAGLSDRSVVESINPSEILRFPQWIEKIIEAAYWLNYRAKHK